MTGTRDLCVCNHMRVSHLSGTGDCVPLTREGGGHCACQAFTLFREAARGCIECPPGQDLHPGLQHDQWLLVTKAERFFAVKDSGNREDFATGSVRDTEEGKVDWTYVLRFNYALARLAQHLMKGAKKYGRHNWFKGQPMSRTERSLLRHVVAYFNGESDEDHLAAVLFNAGMLIDHEERIKLGQLPAELDDRDIPGSQR